MPLWGRANLPVSPDFCILTSGCQMLSSDPAWPEPCPTGAPACSRLSTQERSAGWYRNGAGASGRFKPLTKRRAVKTRRPVALGLQSLGSTESRPTNQQPQRRGGAEIRFSPNSEVRKHTRPRVWLEAPRVHRLGHAPAKTVAARLPTRKVFGAGAENRPRGAGAPQSTSVFEFNSEFRNAGMGRAWFLASGFPGFQIQTQCLCVSAVEMAELGRSLALPARRLLSRLNAPERSTGWYSSGAGASGRFKAAYKAARCQNAATGRSWPAKSGLDGVSPHQNGHGVVETPRSNEERRNSGTAGWAFQFSWLPD